MNIYKIAQSIPKGFVEIEILIDGNGKITSNIIRGNGGTTCQDGDDKMLDDILNASVPGFGGVEIDDTGHTNEYFEQKVKKSPPMKAKPQESPYIGGPFGGTPSSKAKEKEMGLGYGV
jgi:hypothetical protein